MDTTYDAVVIGAGFAGITTARDLADQGRSVLVLEAGARVGGRTYARPFAGREDLTVELGGSWVNRELQPGVAQEVLRYGVAITEDVPCENVSFLIDGTRRTFPVPASELADLERAIGHLRDASKRIAPSQRLSRQPIRDLDISVSEFLAPIDVGPATHDLFCAAVAWYTGADPSQVSVFGIIAQTAGFGHSPFGFFGALTERFVGGAGRLLDRMVEGSRLEVRIDHKVSSIEQADGTVTVRSTNGQSVRARCCVVAVPTNVLRHIDFTPGLSAAKRTLLADNHLGRAYKPSMIVRNLPRRPFALGSGTLQALCLGYEYEDGSCLIMGFGDETSVSDPTSREELETAVREYFPEAVVEAVDVHDWNSDPLFDGTYRVDRPGTAYDFLRAMNEPEGRVVFAGTDVDDSVWRSWIEGAIGSGHRAAMVVNGILHC
jgi:monoamine oxidase